MGGIRGRNLFWFVQAGGSYIDRFLLFLLFFQRCFGVVRHGCFEHRIREFLVVARGIDEALLRSLSVVVTGDGVSGPDSLH